MLVSFTATNFRSIRGEQTLDLMASPRTTGHEDHVRTVPAFAHGVLPVAVLYGAIGAGKSNVVAAIEELQDLVTSDIGPDEKLKQDAFALDPECAEQPTEFVVRLFLVDQLIEYGCSFTEHEIQDEWLSTYEGEVRRDVFLREPSAAADVTITKGAAFDEPEKVSALMHISVRKHQLFLSALRAQLAEKDQGARIAAVIRWFESGLVVIRPESKYSGLIDQIKKDETFRTFLGSYLSEASTGVTGINVTDVTMPDNERLASIFEKKPDRTSVRLREDMQLARKPEGGYVASSLEMTHKAVTGEVVSLSFTEESDGTRRLAHLAPALYRLKDDPKTYVIDELDRSLHPILAKHFLSTFLSVCVHGKTGQLVVTTHETFILDLDLLRRDEVWFVEKDADGASQLYPLSDFKARKDLQVGRNYLQGRFGAIPFVGGIERVGIDHPNESA